MKPFDAELVSGNVLRSVWKIAWPAILLNLVNGAHGFVDHILVGNMLGYEANAAVGASWLLFLIVVVSLASLHHGASVLVARYAGKEDREALSRVVYSALLTSLVVQIGVVAPLGYWAAPYLLAAVNADASVQAHALPYLRIMLTCGSPLFIQFLLNYTMQASGDPRTPLKLGVLNTILNIVLSYVLISGVGPFPKLGTAGAAAATCLAPLTTAGIAFYLIASGRTVIQIPTLRPLLPEWAVMRVVCRIGIPTGLQATLLVLGGVILMRKIGGIPDSAKAQAAYAICYGQLFALVTWTSFGLRAASATIMGQNIGAGDVHRGVRGVQTAAVLGALWAMGIGLAFWCAPVALLRIFDATDPTLVRFGTHLLRVLAFAGVFLVLTLTLTGGLQGAGQTKKPMFIAFLSQVVILLGLIYGLDALGMLSAQRIWFAILAAQLARFAMTVHVFRQGGFLDVDVEIREA